MGAKSLSRPPYGHINAKYPFPGLRMTLNDKTPDSGTPHPLLSHPSPSCRMSGTFQDWEVLQAVLLQETGEQLLLLLLLPWSFGNPWGVGVISIHLQLHSVPNLQSHHPAPKPCSAPRAVPALSALVLALWKCCSMFQLLAQLLLWDRCTELTQHRRAPKNTALRHR